MHILNSEINIPRGLFVPIIHYMFSTSETPKPEAGTTLPEIILKQYSRSKNTDKKKKVGCLLRFVPLNSEIDNRWSWTFMPRNLKLSSSRSVSTAPPPSTNRHFEETPVKRLWLLLIVDRLIIFSYKPYTHLWCSCEGRSYLSSSTNSK